MEETIGWLLPLLIAVSFARVGFSAADQQRASISCLIAIGVLLTAAGLCLVLSPVIHWDGPTIFTLDSFHQLGGNLRLTLSHVPLLWLVWWWMADDSRLATEDSTLARSRRQTALSCLLLLILADDLWLWLGSLVAFSLFQQSLVARGVTQDFRLTVLRGCHWLGVLLLLIGVGILSFDFRLHHFSELSTTIEDWSSFSQIKQAELTLATSFAAWSALLMAAGFPVSVLRIDRDDESGSEILSVALAGAVCLAFAPLISILEVTSGHRSLLFMTAILSAVCSWQQPTVRKARRCVGTAVLTLGLMGLLMSSPGEWHGAISVSGLEHLCLSLLVWQMWHRKPVTRRSNLVPSFLAVLLIAGLTPWPEFLRSIPNANSRLADRPETICLLAAALTFGLVKVIASSFRSESPTQVDATDDLSMSMKVEPQKFFAKHRVLFVIAIAVVITVTSRWTLLQAGLSPVAFPSLAVLGGVLLGTAPALLIVRRQTKSNAVHSPSGSLSRLLETQFHVDSIWQGVIQMPGIVLSTVLDLWEIGRLRAPTRGSRNIGADPHEVPFVWELGLGLASLLVLSCLFLWMGD